MSSFSSKFSTVAILLFRHLLKHSENKFFFRKFPSYRFAAFKRVDCGAVQDRYTVPPRPRHLYFASVSLIFVAISFLYFCSLHFATLIFENSFQDSVFCISESYI